MADSYLCDLPEPGDATDAVVRLQVACEEGHWSHLKSSQFSLKKADSTRINDWLGLLEQVWLLHLEFFQRERLLLQVHLS